MRPLIYYVAASLDGYIAKPDGSIDWLESAGAGFEGEDYGYKAFLSTVDLLLLGRKTYDQMLTFPDYPYPDHDVVVFSRTPRQPDRPRVRFTTDDPVAFTRARKGEPGRAIWLVGGSRLARSLLAAGEVDELIVTTIPIILGDGLPLFPGGSHPGAWKLASSRSYPSGFVQSRYKVRAGASG